MSFAQNRSLHPGTGASSISNFLLWQLAYTELHFTDLLWPEFDGKALDAAIGSYHQRERRFGRTSEQLPSAVATLPRNQDPHRPRHHRGLLAVLLPSLFFLTRNGAVGSADGGCDGDAAWEWGAAGPDGRGGGQRVAYGHLPWDCWQWD